MYNYDTCTMCGSQKYQISNIPLQGGKEGGSYPKGVGVYHIFFNFTMKKHTVGDETIHVQVCYNYYNVIHIHVCLICYPRLEMRQPKADVDLQ